LEELVSGLLRPKLFPFGKLSKAKSAAQWVSGLVNQRIVVGTSLCSLVFSRHNGAATVRWFLQQLHSKIVACTYRYISKQMYFKTPFSHNGCMKSLEFYENYITLVCLEKRNFLTISY
jgi:hypothetical protein